ncbi:sulfide:quinone reductase [Boudabousia liubingyangii]|uniref:Sulfide:quinone reductase n=1 Tax=Boudabousia liubingyangii TaxID=1921764 RepID=A0A1Q5PPN6_9ACTO|nr:FAD-dependent oxidoreductase [Boudabousia liubingyangii]OKL49558.1 sulfide:quinone reductase [Boudabousia liubingyangii]
MADIVILGAGISGHTAALHLRRLLSKEHRVVVVSPNSKWNWIPSNIWVGIGKMTAKDVTFELAPIYKRKKIEFHQAKGTVIHPEGDAEHGRPYVDIEYTDPKRAGEVAQLEYDYLINATGPRLNFAATPGLGPDEGNTWSVCSAQHAVECAEHLDEVIKEMKAGAEKTLVVGMGSGVCTCEGAAFEYTFNVENQLRQAGVRDKATLIYLTNEKELGDFGVDGMRFVDQGFETSSELWAGSLFRERGVKPILGAACKEITKDVIRYETLEGTFHELPYDFAMLLPPFTGQPLEAKDKDGNDITSELFAPNRFMKVDADYTPKPYEEWRAEDWPNTYECVGYPNIFAVGIAFAPPHPISRPRKSPSGTMIAPAPPRTGMPSGVMGKTAAKTIVKRIKHGNSAAAERASLANMGAACVASTGLGAFKGSAASMTMMPVVPDYSRTPTGRNIKQTRGRIGLGGHWVKYMLHILFIYKAKALPGWQLIPE